MTDLDLDAIAAQMLEHSAEKEAAAYAAEPSLLRAQIHRHRATAELTNAVMAVELAGASAALTEAIIRISRARLAVHDLLDERDALRTELVRRTSLPWPDIGETRKE